jgi:hypothetical protein
VPFSTEILYRADTPIRPELKQTRFFLLWPAPDKWHPVRGTLHDGCLDDLLEYEAISWYWGDASVVETTMVKSIDVDVPRNMFEALIRMRLPDRPRRLWTDAVSINQADLEERAAQIRMMGDIYRSSRCILIWLGPMRGPDFLAMDVITTLAQGVTFRDCVRSMNYKYYLEEVPRWYANDEEENAISLLDNADAKDTEPKDVDTDDTDPRPGLEHSDEKDWLILVGGVADALTRYFSKKW